MGDFRCAAAVVVGLILFMTGVYGSDDHAPDSAIQCVFQRYADCYRDIAPLGANFSARFDETIHQINETCRYQNRVLQCVSNVAPQCVLQDTKGIVARITSLVQQLCSNRTIQQTNFLNSSVCYNRYQSTRLNCVRKFSAIKTDAKSLCCSNLRTQACIREDMRHLCPRIETEFQAHVAETFTSHEFAVCGSYLSHCGAATLLLSVSNIALALSLSIMMHKIVL